MQQLHILRIIQPNHKTTLLKPLILPNSPPPANNAATKSNLSNYTKPQLIAPTKVKIKQIL